MTLDNLKNLTVACLLMVLFGAMVNGVLINLLLLPSHLILVEQLSTKLMDLILFLMASLAAVMLCSPTTKWQH